MRTGQRVRAYIFAAIWTWFDHRGGLWPVRVPHRNNKMPQAASQDRARIVLDYRDGKMIQP